MFCLILYFFDNSNRGVEVKLDVPLEMWDKPPVEVTALYKAVR